MKIVRPGRGVAGDRPATATIITIEIVRNPKVRAGFAMHPRRGVVERVLRRISRHRRPRNDREATLASVQAFLYAAVMILVRRPGRTA